MVKVVRGAPWPDAENQATIEAYFSLFLADLCGHSIPKAPVYRELAERFGRKPGSYGYKMQNISAILVRLGWPYLRGLMPQANYQGSLEIAVAEHIQGRNPGVFEILDSSQHVQPGIGPVDLVLHPIPLLISDGLMEPRNEIVRAAKRDYAAIEAANSSLGLAGELVVAENEARLLSLAGHKKLAGRVEHVAQSQGDGLGYDVLSFEPNGRERLIEVKTSKYGIATPFFVTDNEVRVSEQYPETYWLYRLYDFDAQTDKNTTQSPAYRLQGNLRESLSLKPVNYRALPA